MHDGHDSPGNGKIALAMMARIALPSGLLPAMAVAQLATRANCNCHNWPIKYGTVMGA